ncbi:MAG: hypothetical protein ACM3RP_03190 [Chitinophagales bacterium]
MGSNDGRSKALRRLDERLSDVEGALARHEARLAELRQVRERLLAERALLVEPEQEGSPPAPGGAPEEGELPGEPGGGLVSGGRERRLRPSGPPREAAPVGRPEEPASPGRPFRRPEPLDPEKVWETFSAYRQSRGPRVLYGWAVGGAEPRQALDPVGETPPPPTGL